MKTLVGIVTFGNTQFTKLTMESIRSTTKNPIEFVVVIGKPGDYETERFLASQILEHGDVWVIIHNENYGFPKSLNDIYDYAWKQNNFDNLIIAGNDIVAYPYAVDSLINLANTSDYEVISSLQYDVKSLVSAYPEVSPMFGGSTYIFTMFTETPWDKFKDYSEEITVADMQLFDIQNLCLYKKSIFDKIGYTDVAFYPAYFVDNDYARRIVNAGIRCCTVTSARFFHFWSRTIHQGSGGSNNTYFNENRRYYKAKWGGDFGRETINAPILINTREHEEEIIKHYRKG